MSTRIIELLGGQKNGERDVAQGARLCNLLEMPTLLASEWIEVIRNLESLGTLLNVPEMTELASGKTDSILKSSQGISMACSSMGLRFSASYANELIEVLAPRSGLRLSPDNFVREIGS